MLFSVLFIPDTNTRLRTCYSGKRSAVVVKKQRVCAETVSSKSNEAYNFNQLCIFAFQLKLVP